MNDQLHPMFKAIIEAAIPMHQEIFEERLQDQERAIREKMQVLECWKACADESLERQAIGYLMDTYRLMLMDVEAVRRFGPRTVKTSSNDPGYWEGKDRDLKAEREGLSSGAPEDENFGDA